MGGDCLRRRRGVLIHAAHHQLAGAMMQLSAELLDRFWSKVEKTKNCWLWRGTVTSHGYGHFSVSHAKAVRVHRIAFGIKNIPNGMVIDHLCRNKLCVNPSHLEAVTPQENTRRWACTVVECKNGHPKTSDNTVIRRGRKECAICLKNYRAKLKRASIILFAFILTSLAVQSSQATYKAEYANQPQEVQDWYRNAELTPEAQKRFTFKKCCDKTEVVRTQFRVNKTSGADEWFYLDGNEWKRIAPDIIHWGESAPDGRPTLFLYGGVGGPTCFFPGQGGN